MGHCPGVILVLPQFRWIYSAGTSNSCQYSALQFSAAVIFSKFKKKKKNFKRPPNLRDKLCRATVEYPPRDLDSRRTHWDPQRARTPCERDDCQVCPLILHTGRVISHITGRTYHAPIGANCESNNLIYLITCKKCKTAQYVG